MPRRRVVRSRPRSSLLVASFDNVEDSGSSTLPSYEAKHQRQSATLLRLVYSLEQYDARTNARLDFDTVNPQTGKPVARTYASAALRECRQSKRPELHIRRTTPTSGESKQKCPSAHEKINKKILISPVRPPRNRLRR